MARGSERVIKRQPTYHAALIMGTLLNEGGEMIGKQFTTRLGIPSGTLYPLLRNMVFDGILLVREETTVERAGKQGYVRNFHRLSVAGAAYARQYRLDELARLPVMKPFNEFIETYKP